MKLIMENWREFTDSTLLNEQQRGSASAREKSRQGFQSIEAYHDRKAREDAYQRKLYNDPKRWRESKYATQWRTPEQLLDDIRMTLSLLDPTGILSWPEVKKAVNNFKINPSWINTGLLILAILAAIPLFGKLVKAGKISRSSYRAATRSFKGAISGTRNFVKGLSKAKGGEKIAINIIKQKKKALQSLKLYVHAHVGLTTKISNTLHRLAKLGHAVLHTGKLFKGIKAKSLKHLKSFMRFDSPEIIEKLRTGYQKVLSSNTDDWIKIDFSKGEVYVKAVTDRGAISFSKSRTVADHFASVESSASSFFKKLFGFGPGPNNMEIIIISHIDDGVDVSATMLKSGMWKKGGKNAFRREQEVLFIGEQAPVGTILMRRTRGPRLKAQKVALKL